MEHDHLNKLSITFQQQDQCEIWRQLANWFLKNHDFIHVNSTVAGKHNKHKQDGSHLGFPIRMILATVDLQVIVCVEVLRPSQPNGVMSSAVSLPNHTLLGRLSPLSG